MNKDIYNIKDMSFEAKFTIDEEGLRGLAAFLEEQDDEILDAIFSGEQGLILHDPKRGTVEVSRVVRCGECEYWKCNPNTDEYGVCKKVSYDDFEVVMDADDFCSYGERKDDECK